MPNTVRIPFGNPEYPTGSNDLIETLGIRHRDPYGAVCTRVEAGKTIATVGQLISMDGLIYVVPRHDLTPRQSWYLLAAAEEAVFKPPTLKSGWSPVVTGDALGWATAIEVTAAMRVGHSSALPHPEIRAADPLHSDSV